MVTTLAPTELLAEPELAELETVVREGTGAFMKVGVALMKIRDGKGYKLRGYKTFEQYCDKEFGITDRHGRRLIAATEASRQIEAATGQAPASESVARELVNVAKDPIILQKVKDKLEKKHTTLAQASAELVKDVVATVTGKPRPDKASPAPKPAGRPVAAAPAAPSDAPAILELQAVLTRARAFLRGHPAFKDAPDAARLVEQLGRGIEQLDDWLAGAYDRSAGSKAGKGSKADAGGAPRCPSCKQPITPGDPFCGNCGTVL